jgi:TolA-binding protein
VRLLGIAPSLLFAFLVAQSSPSTRTTRGRADAGERPIFLGTDPPGRLRPTPATDAGTAAAPRDAGPDEVHRDLQQLRARLEALEQERAQNQQTAQQLQQLTQEVQLLRQQIADAEAQRAAAEQQRAANRASVQSAVDALYGAQERLAGGNSAIEAALDQAQSTLTGQAQRDIVAARAALRNRDLSAARALLSAAISNAQAGR